MKASSIRGTISGALAVVAFVISSGVLAAQTACSLGVQAYNRGAYSEAIKLLSPYANGKEADLARYYMGLSYQALNQRGQAYAEYNWLVGHSHNQTLRANALIGMQRLTSAQPGRSTSTSSTTRTATASANGGVGNYAPMSAGALHASAALSMPSVRCAHDPNSYFINGTDSGGGNRDCGPSCLSMIFKAYNRYPNNMRNPEPKDLIKSTRLLMTGHDTQVNTTFEEVVAAAHTAGYRTDRFDGIDQVDRSIRQGKLVMMCGSPMANGAYGARSGYNPATPNEGHYIVVTGASSGEYSINDPNLRGSFEISRAELEAFLKFYEGQYTGRCIAIYP